MRQTRRAFLAVAGTITVAGCTGGGDGNGDGSDGGSTPTATDSPMDGDGSGSDGGTSATVQVRSHDELGDILVDAEGMTLYMFDSDTKGEGASTCYEGCAENWPPLTVDGEPTAGDGVTAELTTFERDTGETQVAAAGWPLYYFAPDESPGDATGQGVNDVWWVLGPDGSVKRASATPTPTATESGGGGGGDDGGYY